MSAIYQRARPVRWEDVVGQEHVKEVLKAALEQGRVGHAYLLSGPRGVGKTTTARLIAMTANCSREGPKPCGDCESCLSIRAGSHPDVLEIDAASNNSVDDVRELREKVALAAMRGGKKIYILDEAHMMSKSAFNALLKTLEEPPSHVIFILATTEPEKIIPTILSRCQHYRFRRLTPEEIAGKLEKLAAQQQVPAEAEALNLLGRLADGAMRDGESLLERMLATGKALTKASVEEALGLPPGERVRGIAAALVQEDMAAVLGQVAQLYRDGFAARTIVEGLVSALRTAIHAELGLGGERLPGAELPKLLRLQAALDEQEPRFVRSADQQSLELALTHALLAGQGPSGSAAASSSPAAPSPEVLQRLNRLEKELSTLKSSGWAAVPSAPAAATTTPRSEPRPNATAPVRPSPAPAPASGDWASVLQRLSIQVRAFIKPARMHAQAGYVSLSYDERGGFHARQLSSKFDEVAKIVLEVFGPVEFELIAPDGLGRKRTLGGGGAPIPPPQLEAEPATSQPSPSAQALGPVPSLPALPNFEPNPAARKARRGPDFEPLGPSGEPKAQVQVTQPVSPPSVVAVAVAPPPWEEAPAAQAQAPREYYLPEIIQEEPDWDAIGTGPVTEESDPLAQARFAEYSVPRPEPAPRAAPSPAQLEAKARPGDIRAHPMYEEVKNRFQGRVREIGKNRTPKAEAPAAETSEEEAEHS